MSEEKNILGFFSDVMRVHFTGKIIIGSVCLESFIITSLCVYLITCPVEKECFNFTREDFLDYSFNGSFIIGALFLILYAIDAVVTLNLYELIGFFGSTIFSVIYTTVQYFTNGVIYSKDLDLTLMCITWIFAIFDAIVFYFWMQEYRWEFWKKIGSDALFQRIYHRYQLYKSLIKLDLMFSLCSTVLAGFFLFTSLLSEVLTGLAVLFNFLTFCFGWMAVKKESKAFMIVFFIFALIGKPSFIGYQIFQYYTKYGHSKDIPPTIILPGPFYAIEGFGLFVRTFAVILGIICYRNFGKGLKDHIYTDSNPSELPFLDDNFSSSTTPTNIV